MVDKQDFTVLLLLLLLLKVDIGMVYRLIDRFISPAFLKYISIISKVVN